MFKEKVDPAINGIGTLTAVTCFIGEEFDLLWKNFTVDSKHSTLPRCQKVNLNQTWLERVRRVVHLLCVIKRIVHFDLV